MLPFANLDKKQRMVLQLQDELWQEESERFLDLLELAPGNRVLCHGAGLGFDLPRLARRVGNSGEVVAVEHNPMFAEEARALVGSLRQVSVVIGDQVVQPIPPGPYQASFCCWHQGHPLVGPRSASELTYLLKELAPFMAPGARLGFWEFGLQGWRVQRSGEGLTSLQRASGEWLDRPENSSSLTRLPGALLSQQIILQKAQPSQQAGPPGSRVHRLVELQLQALVAELVAKERFSEEQSQRVWKEWEQARVDPTTLVFTPQHLGIVGQTMQTPVRPVSLLESMLGRV